MSLLVGDVVLVVPHSIYWINIQHFCYRFEISAWCCSTVLWADEWSETFYFARQKCVVSIRLLKYLWFIFCSAELFVSGDKLGDVERARPETIRLNETTLDVWCSLQLYSGLRSSRVLTREFNQLELNSLARWLRTRWTKQTSTSPSLTSFERVRIIFSLPSTHPIQSLCSPPSLPLLRAISKRWSFGSRFIFIPQKKRKEKELNLKFLETRRRPKKNLLINGFHPALVLCFFTSLCLVVVVVLCVTPEEIVSSFLSTSTFNHLLELPVEKRCVKTLGSIHWFSHMFLQCL